MSLDHEAIRKAYPQAVKVSDSTGAFDESGNKITLVQSNIDAARVTLNEEDAAVKYRSDRLGSPFNEDTIYPSIGDQLDLLYKDIVAGTVTTSGGFATRIKATKDKYPKP